MASQQPNSNSFLHSKGLQAFALCAGILFCLASAVQAQKIYGISGGNLVSFQAASPAVISSSVAISGIAAGQSIAGLDVRPATGQLYGLGYNSASGQAQLYVLDTLGGSATPVGAASTLAVGMGKVSMDFNPTVDRIRVTGSNNSNFRLHPVTGALAATDGNLAFAAADVNAGKNPSIGTGAYTNSFIASTSTTLFNYDDSLNVLTTQIPPNNGTLNTVGASGISVNLADPTSDLDIWFDAASSSNIAFFAANTGSSTSDDLYRINLTTGAATLVGGIGGGMAVTDIAAAIYRNVPAALTGNLVYGLTSNNNLITFDSDNPQVIRSAMPVTGLAMGQVLSGMDVRPATGQLYALGYNSTTGEAQLYTINTMTGAATSIAAAVTLAMNLGKIGMDFNPTVDRVRVTSSTNFNYRLHPVTGVLAATDMQLAFAAGDVNAGKNPSIGAVAYTNSISGASSTTLFNYDDSLNVFTTQVPPNNGTLNTIGSSGIMVNLADPSSDFDIRYNVSAANNTAYFAANTGTSTFDRLYTVNLTTGAATSVGGIGLGVAVTDIAVAVDISCQVTYFKDTDNDGYSDGTSQLACLQPTGFKLAANLTATSGDCNDTNVAVNPGAAETCNGLDDNCNGQTDENPPALVFVGNVTLGTQAQVNAFSACNTVIQGNLVIQTFSVDSLPNLKNLRKVTGNVTIKITKLTHLNWLSNLDTIGGTLLIYANLKLATLDGLDGLTRIGGNLRIYYNYKLTDCCAIYDLLESPGGIGGTVGIFANGVGCDNLATIEAVCGSGSNLVAPPGCDDCPVDFGQPLHEHQIKVTPNPASDFFRLESGSSSEGTVNLFDLSGSLVRQQTLAAESYSAEINVAGLPAGMYLVQLKTAAGVISEKIWVVK